MIEHRERRPGESWSAFATLQRAAETTGGVWNGAPATGGCFARVSTDSRAVETGDLFFAIPGEKFDGHAFVQDAIRAGASAVVVSRREAADVAAQCGGTALLVNDTVDALLLLARAWRRKLRRTRVIAVVGAVGKTTTKQFIHAVLSTRLSGTASQKSFNNHVGVPVTLFAAMPEDDFVVVEVGTNHKGEIRRLARVVEPDIVVITNIGLEHLEGLGDLEGAAREECSILDWMATGGEVISFGDQSLLRQEVVKRTHRVSWFGRVAGNDFRMTECGVDEVGTTFRLEHRSRRWRIPLVGEHFAIDATGAIAVGRLLGLTQEDIAHGLAGAQGAEMRFVPMTVSVSGGRAVIYNDAYNANPESMVAALRTFCSVTAVQGVNRRLLMLGQMGELGTLSAQCHREIADHIVEADKRAKLSEVHLIGPLMREAHDSLARRLEWADRVRWSAEMDDEVMRGLAKLVDAGDRVLVKGSRSVGMERILNYLQQEPMISPTAPVG